MTKAEGLLKNTPSCSKEKTCVEVPVSKHGREKVQNATTELMVAFSLVAGFHCQHRLTVVN